MTLQEGIYHRTRPGAFFGILFLRVDPEQPAKDAGAILAELWARYDQLRRGDLPQLPGHPVPDGDLTVLIGFGFNLFARDDIQRSAPPELERFGRFRSPEPGGGGLLLTGAGLHYATDVTKNPATEDVVIQIIANSQLAVNRAIVETWDLLTTSQPVVAGVAPPVQLGAFYLGFQRDDGRSWIDFHDGVSNLRREERPSVIEIKPSGDPAHSWADGGTYLTFIRTEVDLATWRSIPRTTQERLVGRDKLTGAALERVAGRNNVAVVGCPVPGTTEVIDRGNEAFRDVPTVSNPTILASHVQRANHHVPNPADGTRCACTDRVMSSSRLRRTRPGSAPASIRRVHRHAAAPGAHADHRGLARGEQLRGTRRDRPRADLSAAPDGTGGGGLPRSPGDGRRGLPRGRRVRLTRPGQRPSGPDGLRRRCPARVGSRAE